MNQLKNKITNLVTFNFICCGDFLYTGENLTNNPSYILEKWNRYCGYRPNQQYKETNFSDFKQFKEKYHQFWYCDDTINKYLEYFWSIRKSTNLHFVINRFEYFFGCINNITSVLQGGVHPTLKLKIDDWLESQDLDIILRDIKLNKLIN